MASRDLKTRRTDADVGAFLDSIPDPARRADAKAACAMLEKIMRRAPRMWGENIVGFGEHKYRTRASGESEWFVAGVSPRKGYLALYFMPGYNFGEVGELLSELGPHKLGKCCLRIKRLSDIRLPTLRRLARTLIAKARKV